MWMFFLQELSGSGLQIVRWKVPASLLYLTRISLSDMLTDFFAVFMKAVMLIYMQSSKHLNDHVIQSFFQPGIHKAHLSAHRRVRKFFSSFLNGKLFINAKNINWFLMNKHRAIVPPLREVCGRWTKNHETEKLPSLLLGAEANVRIRKHFVLPRTIKAGRINCQLMTPSLKLFKVRHGVITSTLYSIVWLTRLWKKTVWVFFCFQLGYFRCLNIF